MLKTGILIAVLLCIIVPVVYSLMRGKKHEHGNIPSNEVKPPVNNSVNDSLPVVDSNYLNMTYAERLNHAKAAYPFKKWRKGFGLGLTQYTETNCNKMQKVFDDLIAALIAKGENATENDKIKLFETAIVKTNRLNDQIEGLIETGEREDLCELTDVITVACGLNPKKYGYGEGLASEWRDW